MKLYLCVESLDALHMNFTIENKIKLDNKDDIIKFVD